MWVAYPKAEKAVKKHKTAYNDAFVSFWRFIGEISLHGAEEEVRLKGSESVLAL